MGLKRSLTAAPTSSDRGELKYQQGLAWMRRGHLREAILSFAKAAFFVPQRPQPLIAAAECYVTLCDFQGAVKQYRRALWLLDPPAAGSPPRGGACAVPLIPDRNAIGDDTEEISPERDRPTTSLPLQRGQMDGLVHVEAMLREEADKTLVKSVRIRLADVLDALSIVLFNARDFSQALNFAEDSLGLRGHPQVLLHKCAYLIALEREDDAEKILEHHLRDYPSFFMESSSMLVHLYCLRQAFQHAKKLLDGIPLSDRQHPQYLIAQHIFNRTYGVFRERAIDQSDLQGLTRCLTVFPEDASLLFERAKYHINNSQDKIAVQDLFRCIKVSDGGHTDAIDTMTKTLFRIGTSLDGQNGLRDAIDYYTTSLLWHADNIPVILARGDCYAKLEDYQHALQDYMRVDRICPKHPEATRRIALLHDVWGCAFYKQRNLIEAEREFSSAIATCETEPLFYYHRARCRFDLNEPRYALRDVLSCKQLRSEDPIIRDFVTSHLGNITDRLGVGEKTSRETKLPLVRTKPLTHTHTEVLYGKNETNVIRKQVSDENEAINMTSSRILEKKNASMIGPLLTCRKATFSTKTVSDYGLQKVSTLKKKPLTM